MGNEAKVKANLDGLNKLLRSLKSDYVLRVGIIGAKAGKDHNEGLTNAELGAVHEFGGDIHIPAHDIKTYKSIKLNKKGEFKGYKFGGKFRKAKLKSTNFEETFHIKEQTINMPKRSFLEMPLKMKLNFNESEMKDIKKAAWKSFFIKQNPKHFFEILGAKAIDIIEEAFATNGFGTWQAWSKAYARKRKGKGNNILTDTGKLRHSISFKVIKKK